MSEDAKIMAQLKAYWKEMHECLKEVEMDDKHAPDALSAVVTAIVSTIAAAAKSQCDNVNQNGTANKSIV